MESKKIKSALEIALEKAERLGSVSAEELRRQEEEKAYLEGKGLAEKYFAGLPLRDIEKQMARQGAPAARAVRRGLLDTLVDAIGSGDSEKGDSALDAIIYFAPSEQAKAIAAGIERLQHDYVSEKQSSLAARRDEVELESFALLAIRGVAGSAVKPNVEVSEGWLRAQADFDAAHEERLSPLRQQLKSAIQSLCS